MAIVQKGLIVAEGTLEELREQCGEDHDLEELFLHFTGNQTPESEREALSWLS